MILLLLLFLEIAKSSVDGVEVGGGVEEVEDEASFVVVVVVAFFRVPKTAENNMLPTDFAAVVRREPMAAVADDFFAVSCFIESCSKGST